MNTLDEIILFKKLEVAERKKDWTVTQLEQMKHFAEPCLSLVQRLAVADSTGIIAEFKRKSPSRGNINPEADIEAVTKMYTQYGAAGLSILTNEKFFGGAVPDLLKANQNGIPVLRKDFIIDEFQVIAAKAFGADVILLIAACLTKEKLRTLAKASRQLGMEVLLEIHEEKELDHLCDEVNMIGINNRDLKTFEVNIETSFRLKKVLPSDKPSIAESGISSVATIRDLREAGFSGFLIGEHFMKQADPGKAFKKFVDELRRPVM